jgi:hypothetical protein
MLPRTLSKILPHFALRFTRSLVDAPSLVVIVI